MAEASLASFYKYWVWAGIPAMLIGLTALVLSIRGVVTTIKKAYLFKVPVAEKQEIRFAEPGWVILSIEGARLSRRFAHIDFELKGVNGDPVEGHRTWFHARTSGISSARMAMWKYEIPRAGSYVLSMTGPGIAQPGDASDAVVFMKPHLGPCIACVIGIVLASGIFIASLVFFLLAVQQRGAAAT